MGFSSVALAGLRFAGALAVDLLAPASCAACDAPVALRAAFCPVCASTLERAEKDPRCFAAFAYGGAVARAITRFKYESRPDLARPLAELLRRSVAAAVANDARIDLACPVPLHPARLVDRGYNQSALVGASAARAFGIAWDARALVRTKDTPRQATLDREERRTNVAGAFRVRRTDALRGARVLVVDDVFTTGETLAACGAALRAAGAASAVFAVIARAM